MVQSGVHYFSILNDNVGSVALTFTLISEVVIINVFYGSYESVTLQEIPLRTGKHFLKKFPTLGEER